MGTYAKQLRFKSNLKNKKVAFGSQFGSKKEAQNRKRENQFRKSRWWRSVIKRRGVGSREHKPKAEFKAQPRFHFKQVITLHNLIEIQNKIHRKQERESVSNEYNFKLKKNYILEKNKREDGLKESKFSLPIHGVQQLNSRINGVNRFINTPIAHLGLRKQLDYKIL